ncbi:MAG: hypothetical protein ACREOJ_15915 [Gemmatimonadaceae bacterium]
MLPQALELLSLVLPVEFPFDNPPHGAFAKTHIAMWELWPAIDHVEPVTFANDTVLVNRIANLVTASVRVNATKSSRTLEQLGWSLRPPEPAANWDGLVGWFVAYLSTHPVWLAHSTSGHRLTKWYDLLRTP